MSGILGAVAQSRPPRVADVGPSVSPVDTSDAYALVRSLFKLVDHVYEGADHYVFERCEHMWGFLTCAAVACYFFCPHHFQEIRGTLARAGFGIHADSDAVTANTVMNPSMHNDAVDPVEPVDPGSTSPQTRYTSLLSPSSTSQLDDGDLDDDLEVGMISPRSGSHERTLTSVPQNATSS